jgi:PEGA domain
MRLNKMLIPIGALALALAADGSSAEAAQRANRRDRSGRQSEGQARQRSGGSRDNANAGRDQRGNDQRGTVQPNNQRGAVQPNNQRGAVQPNNQRSGVQPNNQRGGVQRNNQRGGVQRNDQRGSVQRDNRTFRGGVPQGGRDGFESARPLDRRGGYSYSTPRIVPRGQALRHYYGRGSGLSIYFGFGSGYRYGSPYYGRVYGYVPGQVYGSRLYYGDVRLQVRPRDAAVYVDGYYAGIVDNFDGIFQRLTLTVGPHEIEIEAPGFEPQIFDVYVDPTRTVDLHADLYLGRP